MCLIIIIFDYNEFQDYNYDNYHNDNDIDNKYYKNFNYNYTIYY